MPEAGERLFRTEDGRLVREGDPAGRVLAYGPGDDVPEDELKTLPEKTGATESKAVREPAETKSEPAPEPTPARADEEPPPSSRRART